MDDVFNDADEYTACAYIIYLQESVNILNLAITRHQLNAMYCYTMYCNVMYCNAMKAYCNAM